MTEEQLVRLLEHLLKKGKESECVEFKLNYHSVEEIGEQISALSNGACVIDQPKGFLIFGVRDENHAVVGTTFRPTEYKYKNQELEHWLSLYLSPRPDFRIHEFEFKGKAVAMFEIPSAHNQPVKFQNEAYVRVGSVTKKLREYPDKERKIWEKNKSTPFEMGLAISDINAADVVRLLDTQYYFELLKLPYPTTQEAVIEKMIAEKMVMKTDGNFSLTNLGALLFAKDLEEFQTLSRRAVRVIVYKGKNKLDTLKDQIGVKGYAVGFKGLVEYINDNLPQNEEISKTIRETVRMYPKDAVRELVANALIHQNFSELGYPIIEIYSDRIEVNNPGLPLITPLRFIDEYQSRNPIVADIMRRLGICEEKGSGFDRVVALCELYQLPAPYVLEQEKHTKVVLYAQQRLNDMDKNDKIRACYQHCCLKYVSNEKMTNQTLRERFKIDERNSALASRIISDTKDAGLIKDEDAENKSYKYARYVPFWA